MKFPQGNLACEKAAATCGRPSQEAVCLRHVGAHDGALSGRLVRWLGVLLVFACIFQVSGWCMADDNTTADLDEVLAERKSEADRHAEQSALQKLKIDSEVRRRLEGIRDSIQKGDVDNAERALIELSALDECQSEVAKLREACRKWHENAGDQVVQALAQRQMLKVVEGMMQLPADYAKKSVAHRAERLERQDPLAQRLTQKMTLRVDDMTLKEFVDMIHSVGEGGRLLNVEVGDAKLLERKFSCDLRDVPFHEVLRHVGRMAEVSYTLRGNILGIQPLQTGKDSQALETRFITLKYGIVPRVPESQACTVSAQGSTSGQAAASSNTAASASSAAGKAEKSSATKSTASTENEQTLSEMERALDSFFASHSEETGGSYDFFPTLNLLMLTDTPRNLDMLQTLIDAIDRPPYQVAIEARFLSVALEDIMDIGVNISQNRQGTSTPSSTADNLKFNSAFLNVAPRFLNAADMNEFVFSGILGNHDFKMTLNAITQKSSTTILAAPQVTVLNNHTARFRKGDRIYYYEECALATVDNGDAGKNSYLVPSGNPKETQLGISFDVTVNVGGDGQTVMLGLSPYSNELNEWDVYKTESGASDSIIKLPRIHKQGIETAVVIRSGETVVLGGMTENQTKEIVTGVPWLCDIPVLGWLFKVKSTSVNPVNLLIFVTATVVNERGERVVFETGPGEVKTPPTALNTK